MGDNIDFAWEFSNKGYGEITVFGQQIIINDTLLGTILIGGVLILLAIFIRIKSKNFNADVPDSKFQNLIEMICEKMHNFTISNMTEKYAYFGQWFFGMFAFILFSNLSGLVGMRPPTADIATTGAFAVSTIFLVHFMGIFKQRKEYWKSYISPNPVFLPINIVGEIAPLISLTFRMFGNIFAGLVTMGLFYSLLPWFVQVTLPAPLHMYFDLFAGGLQAFIFTVLSMVFIKNKCPD